jgi:hypothetical protein
LTGDERPVVIDNHTETPSAKKSLGGNIPPFYKLKFEECLGGRGSKKPSRVSEEAPFSGIVFYFQPHKGLGNKGKIQRVLNNADPRDKIENKGKQAGASEPFKQAVGGFQLQTDGAGFPGVGMAKVGKDEAPRKNRGT